MLDKNTVNSSIPQQVQKQFLRRTPIKLKQFARLLDDMIESKIDALRVKALLSQVTKTREACLTQGFESTARLLNQLAKQLSLGDESVHSQKPLLRRLSAKLMQHAEKLELGVKPQKSAAPAEPEVEQPSSETEQPQDEAEPDEQASEFGLYIDKGKLIFVGEPCSDNSQLSRQHLIEQFESLAVENTCSESLAEALEIANSEPGSLILANLSQAEPVKVLDDEAIEVKRPPVIFIADEDNQENRARAIRNGGSGFLVEPISFNSICEQIEYLYDRLADAPRRVLVMEDSKAQARYYEKVLNKGHFDILVVNNPAELLEALRGFDPETVLMDMQMPGSSGIELTQMIRQLPRYSHLPIIFLSAEESIKKQNQALMSGGTSFIVKPVQKEQLMFMANLYTQRYRALAPQIDVNPDTGLFYSTHFKQMISIETARMSRTPSSIALAIIALDELEELATAAHYSFINSAHDHLAQLLRERLRRTDIIGHLDNGRLGIILTSGRQKDWISIMQNVQTQFSNLPFHLRHQDKSVTISIGLSALSSNFNAHQWLERSNDALEEACSAGRSSLKWFEVDEN
jgi:diguanylate cyclase (GGDEF)-like protein